MLVFVYDLQQGWLLKNIGNGPGLNILVAENPKDIPQGWIFPVRVPSIAKNGEFPLKWVEHVNGKLGVTYQDFQKHPYTTLTVNDQSEVLAGRHIPVWTQKEITPYWTAPGRSKQNRGYPKPKQ